MDWFLDRDIGGRRRTGDWADVVAWFANRSRDDFAELLNCYRSKRATGDRQHRRQTDERARSCSPMMLYGTPVAKMFFEGAPRLLRSGISILPVRPFDERRRDFGLQVRLSAPVRVRAIDNPTGDVLDAVLAAVQAAWSARHREPPDGIPTDCDSVEGWIVDPSLLNVAGR